MTVISIYKQMALDDMTLGNIIIDGFLCCDYSFEDAQTVAEIIIKGGRIHNRKTGAIISKEKLIKCIQRFLADKTDADIIEISDNANEIIRSVV